ncbi:MULTISPECIES: ABC transporter permease/substrate binding protein [Streptomyces]|uniref:ABC transporter permease/substrate binding protein n=1 Tax=Streptomyces mirabilis TaxID=68239 RepID=A0ABU3UXL6_9ACTN|nr:MULTISPECIES: ABC transporter permease/substrate binding protein [Streptomyces]MCX4607517.1 ABC transporter permease/substrate binding protein [Streptomyces mirabilis]MCX5347979.1 ABC transporter permease/substrate binding protein [Streptomyces mirabilis]MDU8998662.1 ABC transporter permease/substrate binding protein [Streptomyces mirabilis]QDN86614.1 ABC transporter permease subunit [Streptomyces sp. RLB3-6]QDO07426.1 ABC transporter permease subunit [Streptomyces sp. S1D4-23]
MPRIPFGDWVNSAVDWLLNHMAWLFDFFKTVFQGTYDGIDAVLQAPEPLLLAGIFAVIAFWLRGTSAGVLTFVGFAFIDSLELWEDAMVTLSLVLVATLIALVVSVPVGIWAARSDRVSGIVRPVLDFMQTLPAMIYLIPAILFFGTGAPAGIVATLIFALAPGVRMTELGIRQVDKELVEAADAFGTTPRDTLLRIQLPLALPTVMAGVNQVIMLGLSMAAIAGMVGTGGLGGDVNEAIGQLNVGLGSEAGVAIVILAIYLDRMTSALGTQVSPLGRRAAAKLRAAQGLKIWSYRPSSAVAVIGVVVLALVAGGMGMFGGTDSTSTAADGENVGQGKKVTIGYIPWDEGVASTFLWKEILEERGFQVDTKQFDAGPLYTSLSQGDIDFETDSWLPTTHEQYWKKYGSKLDDLGSWFGPTSLELSVPSYMKGVDSLADLKGKAGTFGGKVTGIESSAGMMGLLKSKVLKDYGLDKEYKVVDSSTPAMLAELKRAYAKKEPIVVTLWSPHWAYSDYDLKKLKDPKGAWGKGDGVHTLSRKGFAQDNPVVGQWLKNFRMTEKQLTGLEAEINKVGKGKQQDAVRAWLKRNPGVVDKLAPVKNSVAAAETKRPLDVAWFPWDEDVAVSYLWKNVLARRGYTLNLKQMDVGPVYTGLASGDLDLNFDAWLPYAQSNYWDQHKNDLRDLGTWYRPTSLEIAVPSYVKDVKSLADLKGKAGTFGGRIIGIEPGTGEMNLLKTKVLPGYGLDKEYKVVDGSTPAMLAELKRAYAKKQPVAVVLWSPHWAYSEYQLTKLADDKKLFGEGNTIRTISSKKFPERYPQLTKWIKNFRMSESELGTLESEIKQRGQGHEEAAVATWLKEHPDVVERMTPQ